MGIVFRTIVQGIRIRQIGIRFKERKGFFRVFLTDEGSHYSWIGNQRRAGNKGNVSDDCEHISLLLCFRINCVPFGFLFVVDLCERTRTNVVPVGGTCADEPVPAIVRNVSGVRRAMFEKVEHEPRRRTVSTIVYG